MPGRPKALNLDEAMPIIMRLFWRSGFDRLTLDQVAAELGVAKPTLFRTLGDKEAIFAKAIKAYFDTHIRPGERRLETAPTLREGLAGCFAVNVERSLNDENPRGCFLTDTTMSMAFKTGPVFETLNGLHARTHEILTRKIQNAVDSGELKPDASPGAVMGYILAQFSALSAISRSRPDRSKLESIANYMLDGLPWSDA